MFECRFSLSGNTHPCRNKNGADIEEMLGLNVRPNRIVFGAVDDKDLHRFTAATTVDWSKYSV